jgi:hypothetical protein
VKSLRLWQQRDTDVTKGGHTCKRKLFHQGGSSQATTLAEGTHSQLYTDEVSEMKMNSVVIKVVLLFRCLLSVVDRLLCGGELYGV